MIDAIKSSRDLWKTALASTPYRDPTAPLPEEDTEAARRKKDQLEIQTTAKLEGRLQALEAETAKTAQALGLKPGEGFGGSLRQSITQLGKDLNAILSRNRIPVDGPVDVYQGADGTLKVRGNPRMKDLIEKAINADASFRENFDKTASMAKMEATEKVAIAARRAKKKNPEKEEEIDRWLQSACEQIRNSTFSLQVAGASSSGFLSNAAGSALGYDTGSFSTPFA